MNLSGHTVLVTGGTAGIGLAIAHEFVGRGNRVAICGRDDDRLAAAREVLGDVETLRCDLANPGAAAALAEAVGIRFGGLSILVNNAGVQSNYSLASADPATVAADAAREIQINLTSLVTLTAACIPLLKSADTAAVVNLSSALAITPKANAAVYCATKAAVSSFSKALRYQFEDDLPNIQVFDILPALVETAMTAGRTRGKISPQQAAGEIFAGLAKDRAEIRIGKVKLLAALNRLAPSVAARLLRNG